MRMSVDCLPCYLQQALRVARLHGCDENLQLTVVNEVAKLLPKMDFGVTPPENSIKVYETISQMMGCKDLYYSQKKQANREALALLPRLREEIRRSQQPLETALRLAIGGNIIDYGTSTSFSLETAFERCRTMPPVIDHLPFLIQQVEALHEGSEVLYLVDNCGEIVYDSLVMERLAYKGLRVTVAVKESPIINDALYDDAVEVGLDTFCTIISNGTTCPGTPLSRCSSQFLNIFNKADLIIAKGQGNFETLSMVDRDLFFLLTVKCPVVGQHLAELSGLDHGVLLGKGEMVVYHCGNH